jgi:hypothetical protein
VKRLFWFMTGLALGAWAYRYFAEQGQSILSSGPLDERARRLSERAKAFAESGRQLAEEGRAFAQAAGGTAGSAIDTAQERGRGMVRKARARTGVLRQTGDRVREEVRERETPEAGDDAS